MPFAIKFNVENNQNRNICSFEKPSLNYTDFDETE